MIPGAFAFNGETYEPEFDFNRLSGQWRRIYNVMQDGRWRTLEDICLVSGCEPQSASARLRDFRKPKFGGHTVERMRFKQTGLFLYRLVVHRVPETEGAENGSADA